MPGVAPLGPAGPFGGADPPCLPVPGSDAFAARQQIFDYRHCGIADLSVFDSEPGEPWHFQGGHRGTAWWSWRAPGPGEVTFFAVSELRAGMAVYRVPPGSIASLSNLWPLRRTLTSTAGTPSSVVLPTEAGAEYQIVISTAYPDRGLVRLKLGYSPSQADPNAIPGSDAFWTALSLAGTRALGVVNNESMSAERPNEPRPSSGLAGKTGWWRWRAPTTNRFTVTTSADDIRTAVAVYTGSSSFTGLQLVVTAASSTSGIPAEARFTALANTEYRIMVDTVYPQSGNITLKLELTP